MFATFVAEEFQLTKGVKVCVLPSLNVPMALNCWVLPKIIEGAAGVTARETRIGAEPVPDRFATWGLFPASSVTLSAPILVPDAPGLNTTLILQVFPAGRLVPQVLASAKSPVAVMPVIATGTLK